MLAHPATYADSVPHAEFARLRREAAVSWVDEPPLRYVGADGRVRVRQGSGFWAVTRHAAVVAAARDPATFSSAARGAFLPDPRTPEDIERARQLLVNMDAPEHARIRRHLTAAFTPNAVRELAAGVHRHAAALVAGVVGAGTVDAVAGLTAELPLLVLVDLLGMPRADRGMLFRWSNSLVGFDDPEYGGADLDTYRKTFGEAFRYAAELADSRRRHPRDDLVSRLVASRVGGRGLTGPEFAQLWLLLVIAGNETTRHLLSGSLLALAEAPRQRDRLVADPDLTPTAVDELLRWVTPIMQFRRTAVADTELHGRRIAAGDKVVLYYVAANRDEAVYADPDRLDLGRRPNPHLAYGVGPHYCIGSHLASLEARAMLDALRPHLSRLRLAGPPVRLASSFMNGIKSLPVAFADRAGSAA